MIFPSLACGSEESAKGINSAPKSFPIVFLFFFLFPFTANILVKRRAETEEEDEATSELCLQKSQAALSPPLS